MAKAFRCCLATAMTTGKKYAASSVSQTTENAHFGTHQLEANKPKDYDPHNHCNLKQDILLISQFQNGEAELPLFQPAGRAPQTKYS